MIQGSIPGYAIDGYQPHHGLKHWKILMPLTMNSLRLCMSPQRFNSNAISSGQSEWSNSMACFDGGSNNTGVFCVKYQKTLYYFVTEQNKQVPYLFPLLYDKWKESVCTTIAKTILHIIPATRSRPGNETAGPNDDVQQIEGSPSKRQRTKEPQEAKQIFYWPDSPEAYQLFKPRRQGVTSAVQEMTYDCS